MDGSGPAVPGVVSEEAFDQAVVRTARRFKGPRTATQVNIHLVRYHMKELDNLFETQ